MADPTLPSLSITFMRCLTLRTVVAGPLYPFQNITFGTCGERGRRGPPSTSDCTASYAQYGSWTANSSFLSVAKGIQTWRALQSGNYELEP